MSVGPQLDRLGARGPSERRWCMCGSLAWQALGAQACGVNIVQGCASLGVEAQWNRDSACLYLWHGRPWGHVLAKQRSCRAVQALGVWPAKQRLCRVGGHRLAKIVQGCAGLGEAWPVGDHKYLWIPGLKGSFHGDPVCLRGGSLG
jgi:hypothetical protein